MQRLTKYTLANPEFIKPDSFDLDAVSYLSIRSNCIHSQKTNINALVHELMNQSRSYEYVQKKINDVAKNLEAKRNNLVSKTIYEALQTGSIFKSNGSYNKTSQPTIKTTVIRSSEHCVYIDIPRAFMYITTSNNIAIDFIPVRDTGLMESFCKLMTI